MQHLILLSLALLLLIQHTNAQQVDYRFSNRFEVEGERVKIAKLKRLLPTDSPELQRLYRRAQRAQATKKTSVFLSGVGTVVFGLGLLTHHNSSDCEPMECFGNTDGLVGIVVGMALVTVAVPTWGISSLVRNSRYRKIRDHINTYGTAFRPSTSLHFGMTNQGLGLVLSF